MSGAIQRIRGYSFMGKTKAPATLTVPGLSAIS